MVKNKTFFVALVRSQWRRSLKGEVFPRRFCNNSQKQRHVFPRLSTAELAKKLDASSRKAFFILKRVARLWRKYKTTRAAASFPFHSALSQSVSRQQQQKTGECQNAAHQEFPFSRRLRRELNTGALIHILSVYAKSWNLIANAPAPDFICIMLKSAGVFAPLNSDTNSPSG